MKFLIIYCLFFALVSGAIPNLRICSRRDRNRNNCIFKLVRYLKPSLWAGFPGAHWPALDPFEMRGLYSSMSFDENPVEVAFSDVAIYGMSNFEIKNLIVTSSHTELIIKFPLVYVSTIYSAYIFDNTISHTGRQGFLRGSFHDVEIDAKIFTSHYWKYENGITFLKIDNLTTEVSIRDSDIIAYPFEHSYLGDYIEKACSDSNFGPREKKLLLNNHTATIFQNYFGKVFSTVPLNNVFYD